MRGPSSGSAHCWTELQQNTTKRRKKIRGVPGNGCIRTRGRQLGQRCCFIAASGALLWSVIGRGEKKHGGGSVMELRTASPRKYDHTRPVNLCAQCGETIFLPEWSEYLDRHRVRHLWECEACGYKFETLVSFPEP